MIDVLALISLWEAKLGISLLLLCLLFKLLLYFIFILFSVITPFILAWLVSKNLVWAKSGRGQRLARLLTEPLHRKWRDSLNSRAKWLGATVQRVTPRDSTDQIWTRIITRQLVTLRKMARLPRIGGDHIWLMILWCQGKWSDSLQDKILNCPSQDCR